MTSSLSLRHRPWVEVGVEVYGMAGGWMGWIACVGGVDVRPRIYMDVGVDLIS